MTQVRLSEQMADSPGASEILRLGWNTSKSPDKDHQASINSRGTSRSSSTFMAVDEVPPFPDGTCPDGYKPIKTATGGLKCVKAP
jgi:hypothetical protein